MNSDSIGDDIEAASQLPRKQDGPHEGSEQDEHKVDGFSSATCTNKMRNKVVLSVSVALLVAVIATSVALSSKAKSTSGASTTGLNEQDAMAVDSSATSFSPKSLSNSQIPPGFDFCETAEACNQRRQQLGFTQYTVSPNLPSMGCFSKGNKAYFGTGGSKAEMTQIDLPGAQNRIWCQKTEDWFVVVNVGEKNVTYLAPFDGIATYSGPHIELSDGTFFELSNLPPDYDDSDWITGVTTLAIPGEAEFNENGTVDMKGISPRFVANVDTKSKSRYEGNKTVLAVRVVAAGNKTTSLDEFSLSDSIFGIGVDKVNLASQYDACSYGKLKFVTAPNRSGRSPDSGNVDIINGVATVRLPSVSVTKGTATMRNAITKELNRIFGTANPNELADYVMYCLPPGTFAAGGTSSKVGYAYYNSWLSVFNDDWCSSVSLQMHEIGHSLNLGHSNEGGVTYEDGSGIMGASYKSSDRPRMCFNAAKSWQTGWYKDKELTINGSGGVTCFNGTLHGIADFPVAKIVLLMVQLGRTDLCVNFNAQRGINQGTQEGGNQVLVVSRPRGKRDSFAESELVAKLSSQQFYDFNEYRISVGNIDTIVGTADVVVLQTDEESCERT
ncbi:hypothetical protein HJC23_005152 [Cyclotella cryptica]|uniref:Peptidase M11 gametolysin domain-containing protein n=1 Tax=Cyclotella cryptica TaxID=29204 RepID=A0ABD3QF10_9STRA|eukprot:CCRYP_005846-RA/>CCRYP_005846-RA protein AED:0.01 eAED:0.01 QI:390/-1/1/1/-1/1/1/317/611